MHREHERVRTIPAFLICDHRFIRKYGLGLVRPGPGPHGKYLRSGYLTRARSVSMLAQALDLPPETLQQTIENHNRHAEAGVDTDFSKGSTGYNRYLGDMEHGPNPCLAPIVRAPFYAIQIYPGDNSSEELRVGKEIVHT